MKVKWLLLFLVLSRLVQAQGPGVIWAQSAGGVGMDNGNAVATDAGGNVVVTGYFTSPAITFGTATFTNADSLGTADFFITKYDANGAVLWSQRAGGITNEYGNGVATDAAGNIVVVGYFASASITFGGITLYNANPNNTTTDVFIVKYDANGNVLWAKSAGGFDWDNGMQVAIDKNNNVLVTGYFSSSLLTFGTSNVTNSGNYDVFLVKYDAAGNVLWARSGNGPNNDICTSLTTDVNGNVLLAGSFMGTSLSFGTATLTQSGNGDAFLVKYDANGNALWAKSAVGTAYDKINAVRTDANGDIVALGYFISAVLSPGLTTLTNAGIGNLFLVKYDANGNEVWAKSAGGISSEEGMGLGIDAGGNIFVTGTLTSPAVTFGTTTLTNAGIADLFLVKYDAAGNVVWAMRAGGNSDEAGNSISIAANGDLLVTGFSASTAFTFGTTTFTNAGGLDFFLVNYRETLTGIEAQPAAGNISVYPNPFTTQFTISAPGGFSKATLRMENELGQQVAVLENISGESITFPRQHLPAGLYCISLYQDDRLLAVRKVVVE